MSDSDSDDVQMPRRYIRSILDSPEQMNLLEEINNESPNDSDTSTVVDATEYVTSHNPSGVQLATIQKPVVIDTITLDGDDSSQDAVQVQEEEPLPLCKEIGQSK